MKKISVILVLSFAVLICSFISDKNESCSTFMLHHGSELIAGHNLDESAHIPGTAIINKRNVFKKGTTWKELSSSEKETSSKPEWVSKYGSVSFNPLGRDFPDGGMNEKGLIIWEMTLRNTRFTENENLPKLFMMQWMQYQLDNHTSVNQVIKSASEIMLDGWTWHFFTADRNADCASIEFINGKLIVHTGAKMPVPALCNTLYSRELEELKSYKGFGGRKQITMKKRTEERFVHAAEMIKKYDPVENGKIVPYGFDILKQLNVGGNQWSIIVDMKNLHVYINSAPNRRIRHFSLNSFDLSCDSPVKIIDIHADLEGDITKNFIDYTLDFNRKHVKKGIDTFIMMDRDFGDLLISQGITAEILIDRLAKYPESTGCKN